MIVRTYLLRSPMSRWMGPRQPKWPACGPMHGLVDQACTVYKKRGIISCPSQLSNQLFNHKQQHTLPHFSTNLWKMKQPTISTMVPCCSWVKVCKNQYVLFDYNMYESNYWIVWQIWICLQQFNVLNNIHLQFVFLISGF